MSTLRRQLVTDQLRFPSTYSQSLGRNDHMISSVCPKIMSYAETGYARAVIIDLVSRLSDTARMKEAIISSREKGQYFYWGIKGYLDLAILFANLDVVSPRMRYDVIAHNMLVQALGDPPGLSHMPVALFGGLSQLGIALRRLNRDGARYRLLLRDLDLCIEQKTLLLVQETRQDTAAMPFGSYDIISGLSGVAVYLLTLFEQTQQRQLLTIVLETLVWLTEGQYELERLRTPKSLLTGSLAENPEFKNGLINCGVAHGLPGILSVLSLCHSAGVRVPAQEAAIVRLADWLIEHAATSEKGIDWPVAIGLDEHGELIDAHTLARATWCYGTPGVARSLWLAGIALESAMYRNTALSAMESVLNHPYAISSMQCPNVCHGTAGLLQLILRFYSDTGQTFFKDCGRTLFEKLMARYEPHSLLGFRDVQPDGILLDDPTLLNGVSGIVLVLLSVVFDSNLSWDRILVMS